jgi:hypothetical protein
LSRRGAEKRWRRLRAGLDLILDQRGADMADLPGGDFGSDGPAFFRGWRAGSAGVGSIAWRAGLDLILDRRGADMSDLPGGASGLLVRDYRGEEPIGW